MEHLQSAVIFLEEGAHPLALERIQGRPVLFWMADRLWRDGVRRVFAASDPVCAPEVRACFPAGMEIAVSDRHEDLMEFLKAEEAAGAVTAVLARSALPVAQAGAGFAYAAPPEALLRIWRLKMTNAVQEAELLSGWIPLYGPDTLAELEAVFRPEPLESRESR